MSQTPRANAFAGHSFDQSFGQCFDLLALAATFPATSTTMMKDMYLVDTPESSIRLFRVYHEVKPHYHLQCDEILYVVAGRGTMWIGAPENEMPFGPGQLIVFPKKAVHAITKLLEEPILFFTVDAPRRERSDVRFVTPEDGTAESFMGDAVPAGNAPLPEDGSKSAR